MQDSTEVRVGTPAQRLAHLATIMTQGLVDTPQDVHVRVAQGTSSILLELSVDPSEVGQVIGKKGVHADAMRRLLEAAAGKFKVVVVLQIVEPESVRQG